MSDPRPNVDDSMPKQIRAEERNSQKRTPRMPLEYPARGEIAELILENNEELFQKKRLDSEPGHYASGYSRAHRLKL